jgi:hypothetical protein
MILEIDGNSRYRKYKELVHMAYLTNPSSNPIWTFLPSGSHLSAMRLPIHREDQYDLTDSP